MPAVSHRKTRTARAATIGADATLSGRFEGRMRERGSVVRLLLCLLTIVALVVAVEGWKAPFTYRRGDYSRNGILASLGFDRANRFETLRLKADREAEVPYIFRHDPGPLQTLSATLRTELEEIGSADSLEQVSPETRAAFGLLIPEGEAPPLAPAVNPEQRFLALRTAAITDADMEQPRLSQVVGEFERFIVPLNEIGILDPADVSRIKIRPEQRLAIIRHDDSEILRIVAPSDVQIREMLKETGVLGQSWISFPVLAPIHRALEQWLSVKVPATLRYDSPATQRARREARDKVEDVYDHYNAGDVLVPPGGVVDDDALALLRAEYDRTEQSIPLSQRLFRVATVLLMFLVLTVLIGYYLVHSEPRLVRKLGRLGIFLAAIAAAVALGRFLAYNTNQAEVVPLIVTVMVIAVAYNQVLATLTALTLCLILTLSTFGDLGQFVVLLSVSSTAALFLPQVTSRTTMIKVGLAAGAVFFVMTWGLGVIKSQSLLPLITDRSLLIESLCGAGWCIAAGYLVAGSLPFIESAFGIVTDISLLEMSDVSHPLLQELVRRAPGTYNHSIAVASIGETAADRIGANGLLVRVGAYFHDIGKMLKPQYFVENYVEGVESPHAHLVPAMSTLVIIGHVKDGVDLARQHNLPQPIIDFIEQHHGTTLVQYFYHAAARQAGSQPDYRTNAEESSFRYPGPKPQSREAGVMMLADAVESASRTLSDPTPRRIENLVHDITLSRLQDGQFDESSLTMSEIRTVEESLTKSLIGVYHGRVKYPEQRTA